LLRATCPAVNENNAFRTVWYEHGVEYNCPLWPTWLQVYNNIVLQKITSGQDFSWNFLDRNKMRVLYHFASSLIVEQPDYIAVLCRFGLIWYKLLINEWLMPLIMRKLRINQVPSVLSIPYCMYVLPVRASCKVSSTHHPVRSLIHPCQVATKNQVLMAFEHPNLM